MFLANLISNLISKMKQETELGTRIASVHNGSSLFTGDAGQGESNIRRWIIENDWLEAIVALPLKMFYNTGIATYICVLSNRKEERRKGKVQLIDATGWSTPLRKNLGEKGVEVSTTDANKVVEAFMAFDQYEDSDRSKVFDDADFGYRKIVVERQLRIHGVDPNRVCTAKEIKQLKEEGVRDETAPAVIKKALPYAAVADPLHGRYDAEIDGRTRVVEDEPDTELRDWSARAAICSIHCSIPASLSTSSFPMKMTRCRSRDLRRRSCGPTTSCLPSSRTEAGNGRSDRSSSTTSCPSCQLPKRKTSLPASWRTSTSSLICREDFGQWR